MHERLRRWGFRALVTLLLAAGGYYAAFGGVYSALDIRDMQHDREVLQDSVFRLETLTDSLVQRGDSLVSDSAAIERVAREEHGFIRDGELRVRFLPGEEDGATGDGDGGSGGDGGGWTRFGTSTDPATP